jgi:hypothetical protein
MPKSRSWTAISFDDVAMRFAKQSGFIGLEMIEEPMSADEAAAVRNTIPAADGAADTKVRKSGKKRKATSPAEATDAVADEPEQPPPPPQPPLPQQASTSEQPPNASYIKALEKKLRHIKELRQREQQGFELDVAQRQKLGREAELLSSLEAAQRQAQIDPNKAAKKPKRKKLEAAAGATLEGEEEGGAGEAPIRQPAGSLFASLTAELQAAKEAKAEAARRERELLAQLAAERKAGTAAAKEAKAGTAAAKEAKAGTAAAKEGKAGTAAAKKAAKKAKRAATQGADVDADADADADDAVEDAVEDADMSGTSGADGAPATALVSEAWAVLGLHEAILGRLAAAGFKEPTPIQRECLPAALHGRRDVIGAAEVSATDDP